MSGGDMIYYATIVLPSMVVLGYLANKLYFRGRRCKSQNRLDGKVVVITGSNTGIGYETALDLAKRGAKVVLACRDLKKAQKACDKIILESNSKTVFVEQLDLSSFDSIKAFAMSFKSKFNRLDILINNAGLSFVPYSRTKDGFEMMFGTMHLGHFLLTGLLIDLLKSTGSSRIINVASVVAHMGYELNWDDLQAEKNYTSFSQYSRTKLANCLFTYELAKKFGSDGITSVSLHPGYVRSDIFREIDSKNIMSFFHWLLSPFIWVISKSCGEGAQTTIHCAVDSRVPEYNGKYFSDCTIGYCSPKARNPEAAKRLWEISEKLTGISY